MLAAIAVSSALHAQDSNRSVDALTRESDLVVEAIVERTTTLPAGPGGLPGLHTRVELRVLRTFKGADAARAVVWVHGGQLGDRRRTVVGQAEFRQGEHVVVFAYDTGRGLFPTGMRRGKWLVDGEIARGTDESLALTQLSRAVRAVRTAR